jgi:hypothetical protein
MEIIETSTTQRHDVIFDCSYVKCLLTDGKYDSAKMYLRKFFFKHTGCGYFFNNVLEAEFSHFTEKDFKEFLPTDLTDTYYEGKKKIEFNAKKFLQSTEFMKETFTPAIDYSKDFIYSNFKTLHGHKIEMKMLNMKRNKNIIDLIETIPREEIQPRLNKVYDHIKNVLCSGNEQQYEFFINFIACTFGGRKVRKAIMAISKERTGKGLIINNLLHGILGDQFLKTSAVEDIIKLTKKFEGRLLLNFDELPVQTEFKTVSDVMKSLITEPQFNCRGMYVEGYQQLNTFNIIITSNNNCINLTQSNNTKYVCLDVSEKMIGNYDYFEEMVDIVKCEHIKLAFYNDMMERFKTLDKWNEDRAMPTSETYIFKVIEALPLFYKYIKEQYILKNKDLCVQTSTFYTKYYEETKDRTSKNQIGRYLSAIGIESIKKSSKTEEGKTIQYYNYEASHKLLLDYYKNKNWIDDKVDNIQYTSSEDEDTTFEHSIFNTKKTEDKIIDDDKYIKEIEELKRQITTTETIKNEMEEMKKEIEKLKNKNDKLTEDKDKYKTKYNEAKKDKKEVKHIEEVKEVKIDIIKEEKKEVKEDTKPVKEKKIRKKTTKIVKEDNKYDNFNDDLYNDHDTEYPEGKVSLKTGDVFGDFQ